MCLTAPALASGDSDSLGSLCPHMEKLLIHDHRVKMEVILLPSHGSPVTFLQECKDHVTLSHGTHGHYSWNMEMGEIQEALFPLSESP